MNILGIKNLAQSLDNSNRENTYQKLFVLWIIDNSDELILNGKKVTDSERFKLKTARYNIEPKPKTFTASKKKNGVELIEYDFILLEIKRIKTFIEQLNNSNEEDFDLEKNVLKSYLSNLESKIAPKKLINQIEQNYFSQIALDKKSTFYYSDFIRNWYNQRKSEVEKIDNLSSNLNLLDSFLFLHKSYFTDIIKIMDFSIKYNYEEHEIMKYEIKKTRLKDTAISISQFSDVIKKKTLRGEYFEAIKIQDFCLQITDEIKSYLVRHYKIEIENTFIEKQFNSIIEKLKNSIDLEKMKFLKENEKPIKKQQNSLRPNRTDIAYFTFYTSKSKELMISNNFPSDNAWKEIGELFNKNWKNIQTTYNLISSNKAERLKKSKAKNLNFVIEEMLNEHPKAKKEAQAELNILNVNS